MKVYGEYKKTTYDWLPSVPAHWKWLYLSQVSREQCIKNIGNIEKNILSLSYGNIIRKKNIDFGLNPKDYATYQIVDRGNIILRLTDLQNDKKSLRTGIVQERGIITSAYVCIVTQQNSQFLHYLLHSYDLVKLFYGLGGGVRQSIGFNDIKGLQVPIPPREEQDQIVRYLDAKVSKINKLIRIKQKQIALLKESIYSEVNRLIYSTNKHFNIKRFVVLDSDFIDIDENSFYYKAGMLNRGRGIFSRPPLSGKNMGDSKFQKIYKNRIMISGQFAWEGAVAITQEKDTHSVASHRYYLLLINNSCISIEYFWAYLTSSAGVELLNHCSHGAAGRNKPLNIKEFLSSNIPIPSLIEQRTIQNLVRCLEKFSEQTNIFITALTEYRTRLISNVVTGKIDVRGIDITENSSVSMEVSYGADESNDITDIFEYEE